ncbi:hypothetical protein [Mucilaginibacter glaciei]|uniref:DKNYY family protein n=1 Tax=Mucilaginibacter glaciei TaxID=2772109 RepID=A0A926P093_9SPHI|nr:hypothetical protein [Mucilaginibacter glaciei]MBD1395233.1 hypothetical protein [Mucilaginibacter glaciei]
MNCTFFKKLPACLLFACAALVARGQNLQADTDQRQVVFDNTISTYLTAAAGDDARLYSGAEYRFYDANIKGNAYYANVSDFAPGNIEYDGFTYKSVPVLYDVYKDLVVMQLPHKSAGVSLVSKRVQSFDWVGHHFVYVDTDTLAKGKGINAGFYDELYNGKCQILARHSKSIVNLSDSNPSVQAYFSVKKEIFIKKGGTYTNVNSQGDLLEVFKDKKKELMQYISNNQIKFKGDPEQAILKITAYYESLAVKGI